MVEKNLKEKLLKIFDLEKLSFDEPGPSMEQEVIFVEIERSRQSFNNNYIHYRITGNFKVFANSEKLPLGYFSKCLERASASDKESFFFSDLEENAVMYKNIVQRSGNFVFFFNEQYDPNKGEINELELETA